jgi:predicted transcriptional regulator of viral defense system
LIYSRRIALAANEPIPDEKKALDVRRELQSRGDLVTVDGDGVTGLFLVDAPFAILLDISEEQIIQEANPWAVFSHLTALAYHGLTDLIATKVFATTFRGGLDRQIPLGTTPEDWSGVAYPSAARRPRRVRETEVTWTLTKGEWNFGVEVGFSLGAPIYVTDVERTLLDALREPDKSGGISKVFHAWRRAENVDVARLVDYTDRFENQVLRQRVGFLLQAMNLPNPRKDQWRRHLLRGGSARLVPGEGYAEVHSADWNLSLNVPESVLAILGGD